MLCQELCVILLNLFNYVVIDGFDYVWLQTCGNTLRKCCRNSGGPSDILLVELLCTARFMECFNCMLTYEY